MALPADVVIAALRSGACLRISGAGLAPERHSELRLGREGWRLIHHHRGERRDSDASRHRGDWGRRSRARDLGLCRKPLIQPQPERQATWKRMAFRLKIAVIRLNSGRER
jgi:hypothetical protein